MLRVVVVVIGVSWLLTVMYGAVLPGRAHGASGAALSLPRKVRCYHAWISATAVAREDPAWAPDSESTSVRFSTVRVLSRLLHCRFEVGLLRFLLISPGYLCFSASPALLPSLPSYSPSSWLQMVSMWAAPYVITTSSGGFTPCRRQGDRPCDIAITTCVCEYT